MRIAVSAMTCSGSGKSESLVSYNWLRQIARICEVDLITAEPQPPRLDNVSANIVSADWWPFRFFSDGFIGAVKPHYFVFDRRAARQCADVVRRADIFHHIVPQAPRYPSNLGMLAKRFILGPVGGGLRVPESFRDSVESSEPLFSRLRNFDSFRFRFDPGLRTTYKSADIILLTAPYMLDILPAEFHPKVQFVAETAIDSASYPEESIQKPQGAEVVILYVGRITPYKGLEYLIRAMALLPQQIIKRTRVEIVGSGEEKYERRCRSIVTQLNLENRIFFHGRKSRAEVHDHYRKADIFCFPTLAETTGNVLLEAMAMSLPIISTNYGGPAAVVDSRSGILVNPRSPDDFTAGIADAMKHLIINDNFRIAVGAHARRHVIENFSWDAKGRQISTIYDRLLEDSDST